MYFALSMNMFQELGGKTTAVVNEWHTTDQQTCSKNQRKVNQRLSPSKIGEYVLFRGCWKGGGSAWCMHPNGSTIWNSKTVERPSRGRPGNPTATN